MARKTETRLENEPEWSSILRHIDGHLVPGRASRLNLVGHGLRLLQDLRRSLLESPLRMSALSPNITTKPEQRLSLLRGFRTPS